MDIVMERGMEIDTHRLPEMLGIPVVPVSARKKTGLDILMHAVAHHRIKTGRKFWNTSINMRDRINMTIIKNLPWCIPMKLRI